MSDLMRCGVSITYRAWLDLPDELTGYLARSDDAMNRWEASIMQAQQGNVAAGSLHYSDRTEWADYRSSNDATACARRMTAVAHTFLKEMKS